MPNTPLLGFSTGFFYLRGRELPLTDKLARLARQGTGAVEIHLEDILTLGTAIDDTAVGLIRQFEYRSAHLPTNCRYPSERAEQAADALQDLHAKVTLDTAVLHPDLIDDPAWATERFGSLLAIENLDRRKAEGISVDQLERTFASLPAARWVCDVNHVYTLDPSMRLGRDLHAAFADRLAHYHLSGFGGPDSVHACLRATREDAIFGGIERPEVPVILESVSWSEADTLAAEWEYVTRHLA